MANNTTKQDIQLLIKAQDLSPKTLKEVADNVGNLTSAVTEQAAAAEKGQGALKDLTDAYDSLGKAGKALTTQQGQIDYFRDLNGQLDTAKERADTARQSFEQFKQGLGDSATKEQAKQLQQLSKEADSADKVVTRLTTRLAAQGDKLEKLGISTGNLEESQTKLANTAKQIGDAVGTASSAIENYTENLKRARQAEADLTAAERIRTQGAAAQAQINEAGRRVRPTGETAADYVQMLTRALEEQEAALKATRQAQESENTALAEFYAAQQKNTQGFATANYGGIAQTRAQYAQSLIETYQKLDEEEAKLASDKKLQEKINADLAAMQKVAEAARAAAKGYETIATASVAKGQSGKSSISAILDPNAAAPATAQGSTNQIHDIAATAGAEGPVERYVAQLKALSDAQKELVSQAGLIDKIREQQAAFDAANAKLEQNRAEVSRLAEQAKNASTASDELTAAIKQQQSQLSGNAASTQKEAEALAQLKAAAKAAGIDIGNLDGELAKLTSAANTSLEAQTKLREAIDKANKPKGGKSFFGLEGYQLNYLAYDLKSVVDQLGAGAHVTQILGEHAGQLLVVWPQAMTTILTYSKYIGIAAGAFYTLYSAISRVIETDEAIRRWGGVLAQSADASKYSATQIVAQQRALQGLGASFEEAGQAFQTFFQKGYSQNQFAALGKAALDLSDVMGVKLPEAAKQISEAFHGNIDDIDRLDEQYHFLTEAQRKHIQELFNEGKAQEARTEAARVFEDVENNAADKARGPWTDAVRAFRKAWEDLLDTITNSPAAKAALQFVTLLADGIKELAAATKHDGTTGSPGAASSADLQKEKDRLTRLDAQRVQETGNQNYPARNVILGELKAVNDELEKRPKNYDEIRKAADEAGKKETQQQANTQLALLDRDKLEEAIFNRRVSERNTNISDQQRLEATRKRALKEAAKQFPDATDAELQKYAEAVVSDEQNKIDRRNERQATETRKSAEALASELSQMYATIDKEQKTDLDAQLQAIDEKYKAIFTKISEFQRLPGAGSQLINGLHIDQFKAAVIDAENEMKKLVELKVDEASVNDLLKERQNIFDSINLQVQSGTKSAVEGYRAVQEANDKLSPKIADAAKKAEDFARAIRGAKPDPQLDAAISKYQGIRTGEANPTSTHSAAGQEQKVLNDSSFKPLEELQKGREAEIKSITDLQAAGAITATEAEARTQAAYDRTTDAIKKQAETLQRALDLAKAAGKITPEAYDLATNKIKLAVAQTENLNSENNRLRKTSEEALSQGIVTFADDATTALGSAIAGTKSWGDAFKSVEGAALSFFANFAKKIADTILQMYALKAATALIGAFGGGAVSGASGAVVDTVPAGSTGASFLVQHAGGITGFGSSQMRRRANPALWNGAPRYHTGSPGIGLASNEQAAILQKGEQVLSVNDPRNTFTNPKQAQSQRQSPVAIRQVLAIGEEQIASALQGAAGEHTVLTHIKNNLPTLKQYFGTGR